MLFVTSSLLVANFGIAFWEREAHYKAVRDAMFPVCFPIGASPFETIQLIAGLIGISASLFAFFKLEDETAIRKIDL